MSDHEHVDFLNLYFRLSATVTILLLGNGFVRMRSEVYMIKDGSVTHKITDSSS